MVKVYLKTPSLEELSYRKKWMRDPKTMEYNAGANVNIKGYDYETGTITWDDETYKEWYYRWIGNEPNKYFAYIFDESKKDPVGEIYFYYNSELNLYNVGIVISADNRGNGYSYLALKELEKVAFEKYNLNALSDIIPESRIGAIKSFKKAGFIQTDLTQEGLNFGKKQIARQLLITNSMYKKINHR